MSDANSVRGTKKWRIKGGMHTVHRKESGENF